MSHTPLISLGCGTYQIMVQTKCGTSFLCELKDASSISYNRILNEISTASIKVGLTGTCCDCLASVNPWQHEIAIFRDGLLVWVGPIIDITFDMANEEATIECRDLMTWTDHRLMEVANTDLELTGVDLAVAYDTFLHVGYDKDPWCMTWEVTNTGTPFTEEYPAFDKAGGERWGGRYEIIGDLLRVVSDAGVDYTAVGRHLWTGAASIVNPAVSGVILTDNAFQRAPTIKVAGSKMVTRQVEAGGQGGNFGLYDDQIWIDPSVIGPITPALLTANQAQYGLLEDFRVIDEFDEVDTTVSPNALRDDAEGRILLLNTPYVYLKEGILHPNTPLTFADNTLIPGAILAINLATTCRPLTDAALRLQEVKVTVDAEGGEAVAITLSPIGRTE